MVVQVETHEAGRRLCRESAQDGVRKLVLGLEERYGSPPAIPRFDPMDELISCILSQHTTDANSFPAFHRLRERFGTWNEVVEAGPEPIAEVIRSSGLANQKSRTIVRVLERIRELNGEYRIDHLAGMEPREARMWLEALPGVGPKTATIVLCFSFGMDVIPVDTHVFRVAWRLGLIPREIGEAKAHDALQPLVPKNLSYRLHMGLIQHGRKVCRAPKPNCAACHLTDVCAYFRDEGKPRVEKPELEGV